ncbi:MAG: hypothetical protein JXQ23_04575 [Clostridia bacterium]|nr:hypothetical protein [Clostridia bacterium]
MKKNGFVTLEAILVFPGVMLLIIAFIIAVILMSQKPVEEHKFHFTDKIYKVDSLKRKAGFIDDMLQQ